MGNDVHESGKINPRIAMPRVMRWGVLAIELAFVVLLAYLLAQLTFQALQDRGVQRLSVNDVAVEQLEKPDLAILSGFDPFFRQIAEAPVQMGGLVAPESTLKIDVFGLRATGDGEGTAIVKMQDNEQKLVRVGEEIASGVKLVGVFVDRLEISRGGVREAVFLRPQAARQARPIVAAKRSQTSASIAATSSLAAQLVALDLRPVRRNRRIIGFRLPESLPAAFRFAGLEPEDILLTVNGSPLASHERVAEIVEEAADASRLTIEVERRGEKRQLSLNLEGTR